MAVRYTREALEEAASGARTLTEAIERLGFDPRDPGRRNYLGSRFRELGIGTAHFEDERVRWTRAVLERAVALSTNMNDVLRHLGVDRVGGWHTHITRRIRCMGIDTTHFTGAPANPTSTPKRLGAALLVLDTSEHPRRVPGARLKRALLSLGVEERCTHCGMGPVWQGKPLSLEVDHLNGDWRDNQQHNLRLMCPNCHSATDTYRGRKRRSR